MKSIELFHPGMGFRLSYLDMFIPDSYIGSSYPDVVVSGSQNKLAILGILGGRILLRPVEGAPV